MTAVVGHQAGGEGDPGADDDEDDLVTRASHPTSAIGPRAIVRSKR